MDLPVVVENNENIITNISNICTRVVMGVASKVDGLIANDAKTASEFDHTVKVVKNIVKYEVIRRHGDES